MLHKKISKFAVFAVLVSSLLWGCDTSETGQLILASIADNELTITYSKSFPECVYLLNNQNQPVNTQEFYCQEGEVVTVVKPISEFGGLDIGQDVKLCHGANYDLCSDYVTILDGRTLEYDPALLTMNEEQSEDENNIDTPRILLMGDSWAYIIEKFNILDSVLFFQTLSFGKKVEYYTNPGMTARSLAREEQLNQVAGILRDNPGIDIVILSIGGNDLIQVANVDLPEEEKVTILENIQDDIEIVANNITSVRNEIKLLILSYDYPNFDESITCPIDLFGSKIIFEGLKSSTRPTTAREVNEHLLRLGQAKWEIANGNARTEFQNNYGLMQWRFGYLKHRILPRRLPLPETDSAGIIPGGDPDYYSPPRGMLHVLPVYIDAYHLSSTGYRVMIRKVYDDFLEDWLF